MTRLTDDELTELERLGRGATPGPWEYSDNGFTDDIRAGHECLASLRDHQNGDNTAENAKLVAAVRNALPSLLAEVRELRAFEKSVMLYARREWVSRATKCWCQQEEGE
jgi:hypothetical protein